MCYVCLGMLKLSNAVKYWATVVDGETIMTVDKRGVVRCEWDGWRWMRGKQEVVWLEEPVPVAVLRDDSAWNIRKRCV